jgi:hypothetical protein
MGRHFFQKSPLLFQRVTSMDSTTPGRIRTQSDEEWRGKAWRTATGWPPSSPGSTAIRALPGNCMPRGGGPRRRAHSDDVDQSFRSHADQIGAKRREVSGSVRKGVEPLFLPEIGQARIRRTEVRPMFRRRAISDLLTPARRSFLISAVCTAAVAGRPSRFPFSRALARPARVRS